ncbi:DUF6807 domain-containing protein [Goodfellowiella coeruleoviolacea]|uniref:Methane oxygenase PmoA n=1 Tax=Goodfellowiella coeruleoviolacea TaxID=334858 RepID=A0AAE3GBG5_9PSEU|nr:PmoA family protein [Goodfellowiella coeruleoviolacea]MCP2164187.1 Methane oxygenase PmoA [Goodfellowiella coeruleoviolacea]
MTSSSTKLPTTWHRAAAGSPHDLAGSRGGGGSLQGSAGAATGAAGVHLDRTRNGVRVLVDRRALLRYVTLPETAQRDSPKPYLHPLRTTAGQVVTAVRPHDHPWHNGLQLTSANLSGQNFWGGRTYVRDQGYVPLPNNGSIRHLRWRELATRAGHVVLSHDLRWTTSQGQDWIAEERTLQVRDVDFERGAWLLRFSTRLRNISGAPLRWGSPTTEGRPMAGYGGLFWRGPRSFVSGSVRTSDGVVGDAAMGHRSAWLAYTGTHDGSLKRSTLVFVDSPGNPRWPTPWFVRSTPYPVVSFAFAFDQPLLLPAGDTLTLDYHVVIADGAWSTPAIQDYLAHRVPAAAGAE